MMTSATAVQAGMGLERPEWLPSDRWPFEVRELTLDGHRLHYLDEGAGPTLLFVHAGMWSFVWRDAIVRLRDEFRCVALDFPGHGLSELAPDGRVGLASHAAVLERFVERLELTDVTLVTHDLGGPVGLAAATRAPGRYRAIVAANTFAWAPTAFPLRAMLRLTGSAPVREVLTWPNLLVRATSTKFGVGRHLDAQDRRVFRGPFALRSRRRAFHRLLRDASRSGTWLGELDEAVRERLADRPLLTIFGERNDPFGFQDGWRARFADTRSVAVAGGNHFPMNDDPELFAASIARWHAEMVSPAEDG